MREFLTDNQRSINAIGVTAVALVISGCASTAVTREAFIPVPVHPARSAPADVRGAARDADRLSMDQQIAIIGDVIRRFHRPMMRHARWIDPHPLAHERTRHADSLARPNYGWAIAIVDAARLDRVCPLTEANERCRGLEGGVLRFSAPYAVGAPTAGGADSALVYMQYTPRGYGSPSEIEVFVARDEGTWRVVSQRAMPEILAVAIPRRVITDPNEMVDSLLAADRAFAAAARTTDVATALGNMFVGNVVMIAPGGLVRGRDSAIAALRSDSDDSRSRADWTPIKGGVSSDGEHGFTLGYMTVTRSDESVQRLKYVAYWVRGESGWRVAAYKRAIRAAGDVSLALLPPSLPTRSLPRGDERTVQRYADELSLAEHAFSRDAEAMGLGAAFEKWGAPDAIHVGNARTPAFTQGPKAIARMVTAGDTVAADISWGPETVIVSTTGDLGVSIGTIRVQRGGADPRSVPFFTIWKRSWPTDPWRYVAE